MTLAIVLLFPEHGIVVATWAVLLGSLVAAGMQMDFPCGIFG